MADKNAFIKDLNAKYVYEGERLILGKAMFDKEITPEVEISIPLKTFNRHGLIAGATGTGKTKTLQLIVEGLSLAGVPTLVMDIKGDLSGLAAAGDESNKHIIERHKKLKIPYNPQKFPVELLSLSKTEGVRLRSTVSEFGPILFSKILDLNDTQQSIVSIIYKYCDDKGLPLVDLQDLKKVMQYMTDTEEGKEEVKQNYGAISPRSLSAILRKIVALEQQGADMFFGEPSFDVEDLLRKKDGLGVINILKVTDLQTKPHLFSTFMLSLLAEVYNTFPEVGDSDKPKLAIFIDEAHLIFNEASKALMSQIETVVKLIRSKGVGIFFITQIPGDIPENILSQLGLKIQHALRGFTAKDRKEIKKAVENYPLTDFYKTDELITELGIGEAFVTALNEKGIPTPLAHTYLVAPKSRMGILSTKEIEEVLRNSDLVEEYNQDIDKESAYEILTKKMEEKEKEQAEEEGKEPARRSRRSKTDNQSTFEAIMNSRLMRDIGRTITREGSRAILGMLGIRKKRSYRRRSRY